MNDTSTSRAVGAADPADHADLAAATQSGDRAAMQQLLARHFNRVDGLRRRALRHSVDAERAVFQAAAGPPLSTGAPSS